MVLGSWVPQKQYIRTLLVSYRELYAMGATGRDDLELDVFWSNFKKPRFDQRFAGFGVPGLVSNSQRVHIYILPLWNKVPKDHPHYGFWDPIPQQQQQCIWTLLDCVDLGIRVKLLFRMKGLESRSLGWPKFLVCRELRPVQTPQQRTSRQASSSRRLQD